MALLDDILGRARTTVVSPVKLLLNRLDSPVLVLLYHRVTSLTCDPEMLAVTPDNFRAQLRHLKTTVPIVRFEDVVTRGVGPAVAITFDDGYADNLLEALPILEEVGVPATFFISTRTIGSSQEFWWHELERIILERRELPGSFTLGDDRLKRSWSTGSAGERQEFYHGMVTLLNGAAPLERDNRLEQLRHWAGGTGAPDHRHRVMTHDELRRLATGSGVSIGAHTVTHSRLASLSPDEQRQEMSGSKQQLEQWLKQEITLFSYPFGKRCDYTRTTVDLCRQIGFQKAASNFPGQTHCWSDPYQIPRHLVRNWPAELFAEKLRGFWTR